MIVEAVKTQQATKRRRKEEVQQRTEDEASSSLSILHPSSASAVACSYLGYFTSHSRLRSTLGTREG